MSISSIIVPKSNKLRNLSFTTKPKAEYSFQLADIITEMNVISSQSDAAFDRSKVKNVTLGSNISSIGISCFIGCENLTAVNGKSLLKDVGDYAFKDCVNLKHVSFLENPANDNKLYNIGVSAFANTGLENISISLSGTSTGTQILPYAFAGCKSLKSVENIKSNYLAPYEFAGCTALTSVKMPNSHSFSGDHAFKDCSSLPSVIIPANTFMVNDGMFMGCSSMTSVIFNEPSQIAFINAIGNNVFNGTALTSLTFPASITSYVNLAPLALSNMPNLREIHFNGIPKAKIGQEYKQEIDFEFKSGFIYSSEKKVNYGVFDKSDTNKYDPSYSYNDYFIDCDEVECKNIMNTCIQSNIPVVVICGGPGCERCDTFARNVTRTKEFLGWLKSKDNKFIVVETVYNNIVSPLKRPKDGFLPNVYLYWKNPSTGEVHSVTRNHAAEPTLGTGPNISKPNLFISVIQSTFADYSGNASYSEVVDADIINNHCFGLKHDVFIYGNDSDKPVQYKDDGSDVDPTITYNRQVQVDKITVDDFRYGQWYYNAEPLREYADKNYLPVLAEIGSAFCGPCEDLGAIFNTDEFQAFVKQKKMLLCRIGDAKSFDKGAPYYITNVWARRGIDYPEGKMPILMFYYVKKDGATDGIDEVIDATFMTFAHFNKETDKDYPNCKLVYDKQTVMDWIKTECFDMLDQLGYKPNAKFDRPNITSYLTGYPRYSIYANQTNDTYGRYFPVSQLDPVTRGVDDEYVISVRNSSGNIAEYTISLTADSNLPPKGTYQYFTMLSDGMDKDLYDANYDISGIIFKVDNKTDSIYLKSDSYSYGQKLFTTYLTENGLTGTHATVETTSFNNVYIYDENDDPTTAIDFDNFDEGEPIYNVFKRYSVKNITKDGKNVSRIDAYISSTVEVTGEAGSKVINPTGDEYLMSCNWYYSETGNDKVAWISAFSNWQV